MLLQAASVAVPRWPVRAIAVGLKTTRLATYTDQASHLVPAKCMCQEVKEAVAGVSTTRWLGVSVRPRAPGCPKAAHANVGTTCFLQATVASLEEALLCSRPASGLLAVFTLS
mmetsp:Transcript_23382/g.61411  ORF Transcript_23382/g.61411 Transcript_23382/m.61411 type:complete len:113 (-) Transcript_23382:27-365(-)